jgi:hypothetical protein
MNAASELACLRAYRAAMPCEIMLSCEVEISSVVPCSRRGTHAEEHPARHERHLDDRKGDANEARVLGLERLVRDRRRRWRILEAARKRELTQLGRSREPCGIDRPWLRQIREVRKLDKLRQSYVYVKRSCAYGRADGAELPVKNAYHAVLSRVEHEIVELVIAVHYAWAELGFVRQVRSVPLCESVKAWDRTHWCVGLDIDGRRLGARDGGKGLELARKVRLGGAKGGETE